jgi:hypothetical protein
VIAGGCPLSLGIFLLLQDLAFMIYKTASSLNLSMSLVLEFLSPLFLLFAVIPQSE